MNKLTKTIVGAAIATLAVIPAPLTLGQAQDAQVEQSGRVYAGRARKEGTWIF